MNVVGHSEKSAGGYSATEDHQVNFTWFRWHDTHFWNVSAFHIPEGFHFSKEVKAVIDCFGNLVQVKP